MPNQFGQGNADGRGDADVQHEILMRWAAREPSPILVGYSSCDAGMCVIDKDTRTREEVEADLFAIVLGDA